MIDDPNVTRQMHWRARLFMDAADPILIQDLAGMVIDMNHEAVRMYGWSRDELLGQTVKTIVPPDRHGQMDELLARCRQGDEIRNVESLRWTKKGTVFPVLVTLSALTDGQGQIVATATLVKDITQLKYAQDGLNRTQLELKAAEEQLHLAREVQRQLYPTNAPALSGFDLAGAAYPATQACGDYFDFVSMQAGTWGLIVGDVSGHGLPPALMMISTRAYLRSVCRMTNDPSEILSAVNDLLVGDHVERYFVSLFVARFDPSQSRVSFSAAGHQAFLIRATGHTETLDSTGPVLAILDNPDFDSMPWTTLEPDDVLLIPTDGIYESRDAQGNMFGVDRMLDVVRSQRSKTAAEIVLALYQAAREFTHHAAQQDDMTAIALKVL